MERCRLCEEDAVVVHILDDGARVPYCREHMPVSHEERLVYEEFLQALSKLCD